MHVAVVGPPISSYDPEAWRDLHLTEHPVYAFKGTPSIYIVYDICIHIYIYICVCMSLSIVYQYRKK